MLKQKYFTQRLTTDDKNLLYNNPNDPNECYTEFKRRFIKIVHKDMMLLSTIVTPIYTKEYGCDDWDSWCNRYYWYHINQDKKEMALDILGAYYGPCGEKIRNPKLSVWTDMKNKMFIELKKDSVEQKIDDDLVFNCLRAAYFYNNHNNQDRWCMSVPYDERICESGQIDVGDFIETVYGEKFNEYKIRYTKPELKQKVGELCNQIVDSRINREVIRIRQEQKEIENAYAVLQKHGLLPASMIKNNQKQHS